MTAIGYCKLQRVLPQLSWVIKISSKTKVGLVLAIITFAIRLPIFGDPNYHVDEGFYLLVGKAMNHGALPYIDIWDRKPLGLFLLYAGITIFGGSGILQYQIIAALFTYATAFTLFLISARISNTLAGLSSGIVYIATLEMLAGGGGQSPIFYNLFIALAVLATLKALEADKNNKFYIYSMLSMLLCGISIFIKQTSVVESCFLGIVLTFSLIKREQFIWRIFVSFSIFIILGLLPTAIGFIVYVLLGHGQEYYFANFVSIFLKAGASAPERLDKAIYLLFHIAPLLIIASMGVRFMPWKAANSRSRDAWLITGWLGAAMGGFLIIPNFYDHYALPLVAALSVTAAPVFARPGIGLLYAIVPFSWALGLADYPAGARTDRSRAGIEKISFIIKKNLRGGCLYVFDGPPILYDRVGSCLPTTRVFSEHMNFGAESNATGIDTGKEMTRILASKPTVIVKATKIIVSQPNWLTRRMLNKELHNHYNLSAVVRVEDFAIARKLEVWVRHPH